MQKNMTLNLQVPEQDYFAIEAFADYEGETIASLFLRTIREKMEDCSVSY